MAKNELKVGQKVKFDEEKRYRREVRAVRENSAILTTLQFGKVWYTILDFTRNVRGPDNAHGIGYLTQEDIDNAMLALFGEHPDGYTEIEVSYRRCIPLNISGVKDS